MFVSEYYNQYPTQNENRPFVNPSPNLVDNNNQPNTNDSADRFNQENYETTKAPALQYPEPNEQQGFPPLPPGVKPDELPSFQPNESVVTVMTPEPVHQSKEFSELTPSPVLPPSSPGFTTLPDSDSRNSFGFAVFSKYFVFNKIVH